MAFWLLKTISLINQFVYCLKIKKDSRCVPYGAFILVVNLYLLSCRYFVLCDVITVCNNGWCSPIIFLQLNLCPQVISCIIGVLRHYDNKHTVTMCFRSIIPDTGSSRTGNEWYRTYRWRAWTRLPGRTAGQLSARRCVCPDASHRTDWCRQAGVWVCWL